MQDEPNLPTVNQSIRVSIQHMINYMELQNTHQ